VAEEDARITFLSLHGTLHVVCCSRMSTVPVELSGGVWRSTRVVRCRDCGRKSAVVVSAEYLEEKASG
jgi:NAD-dependent SIR2 family protein deacetylase